MALKWRGDSDRRWPRRVDVGRVEQRRAVAAGWVNPSGVDRLLERFHIGADLRQAAVDWARHKQRMVKKSRIQSEDAWAKALKRMTKYPGPVVVEMIETAMSNNWVGWEHEPKQINVAKAGVKVRKDREVHYDSIPT